MTINDLHETEYDAYYSRYITKLPETLDLRSGFLQGKKDTMDFFKAIPQDKWEYRYAPDKWTIKQVLQHLIDTERIFAYRTFRIARRDKTALAPFDQNIYMEPSAAHQKSSHQLLEEYRLVRESTISLVNSLSNDDLCAVGVSSGTPMSAGAAAFTIIGHDIWHIEIIKERYL